MSDTTSNARGVAEEEEMCSFRDTHMSSCALWPEIDEIRSLLAVLQSDHNGLGSRVGKVEADLAHMRLEQARYRALYERIETGYENFKEEVLTEIRKMNSTIRTDTIEDVLRHENFVNRWTKRQLVFITGISAAMASLVGAVVGVVAKLMA